MSDTDTKSVEVDDPPVAEVSEVQANDPEVKANDPEVKAAEEPTNESTTGEDGVKKNEAEGAAPDDDTPSIFRPPPGMLRVTGPRKEKKFVKSDPASLAESDDPREIRKQVSLLRLTKSLVDLSHITF